MNISEQELERAVVQSGLSREQARNIWQNLQADSVEPHFGPIHVAYFFGALLVIGAMGWFVTNGWDRFSGWQLSAVAAGYAVVFTLVGRELWRKPLFQVAGGLLITVAVCMTPLAVFGIERQFHLWPASDPGSYTRFHPYIDGSWVAMEIATVFASAVALFYFRFPFLTAPAAYALWYMSMDATGLMVGRDWGWRERCTISLIFGLIILLTSYWIDHKTDLDYSFWGYLFGLLAFSGGLTLLGNGNQLAKFGYCLVHLALIVLSLVLRRKVFLVFGSFGVFGYLTEEAYTYFRDSVAFPFVLSFIGIAIIFAAMKFKKNEAALQLRLASLLSRGSAHS